MDLDQMISVTCCQTSDIHHITVVLKVNLIKVKERENMCSPVCRSTQATPAPRTPPRPPQSATPTWRVVQLKPRYLRLLFTCLPWFQLNQFILKKDDEGKNFLIIKIINKDMLDHCYNYAGTSIELFSILVPA